MNAYYIKKAEEIFPIFGVNSLDEASQFVLPEDHRYIVETDEKVYMNLPTGSVDFASGWDDLSEVVDVEYSAQEEQWIEV